MNGPAGYMAIRVMLRTTSEEPKAAQAGWASGTKDERWSGDRNGTCPMFAGVGFPLVNAGLCVKVESSGSPFDWQKECEP